MSRRNLISKVRRCYATSSPLREPRARTRDEEIHLPEGREGGLLEEPRPGDPGASGVEPPRDAAQSFERDVLEHVDFQVCSGHCLPLAFRG